jgi:anti-anti-sigma factor
MTPARPQPNCAVLIRLGEEAIIALSGELDLAAVDLVEAALDGFEFRSVRRIVLDLEQLAFIDLSGLRIVLRVHETCVEESVALTVTRGPRAVQRLFELTGTDRLLPFDAGPHRAHERDSQRPR